MNMRVEPGTSVLTSHRLNRPSYDEHRVHLLFRLLSRIIKMIKTMEMEYPTRSVFSLLSMWSTLEVIAYSPDCVDSSAVPPHALLSTLGLTFIFLSRILKTKSPIESLFYIGHA